jgi:hypothetical protein
MTKRALEEDEKDELVEWIFKTIQDAKVKEDENVDEEIPITVEEMITIMEDRIKQKGEFFASGRTILTLDWQVSMYFDTVAWKKYQNWRKRMICAEVINDGALKEHSFLEQLQLDWLKKHPKLSLCVCCHDNYCTMSLPCTVQLIK